MLCDFVDLVLSTAPTRFQCRVLSVGYLYLPLLRIELNEPCGWQMWAVALLQDCAFDLVKIRATKYINNVLLEHARLQRFVPPETRRMNKGVRQRVLVYVADIILTDSDSRLLTMTLIRGS